MSSGSRPPSAAYVVPPGARGRGLFTAEDHERVKTSRGSTPTPLVSLPGLAHALGVGGVHVKDESRRDGLNAFKVVGVRYALSRLALAGRLQTDTTLVAATAGNHGRAVAALARQHSLASRIHVPFDTPARRVEMLLGEGAEVVRSPGDYEAAVREAAAEQSRPGVIVISDVSWEGNEEIPAWIMAGYGQILAEALGDWPEGPAPDILIVQGGVGGLACGIGSWMAHHFGDSRPAFVVAEPLGAACLLASAQAGHEIVLSRTEPTTMICLRCRAPSPLAWRGLQHLADVYVGVDDGWVADAIQQLARPLEGDPALSAGASGACGLAALLALAGDPALSAARTALGMSPETQVLLFVTEGSESSD